MFKRKRSARETPAKETSAQAPDETQYDEMIKHSEWLNDPAREARMNEMQRWAELTGAMTEEQARLFSKAGRRVLEAGGSVEQIELAQNQTSRDNAKRVKAGSDYRELQRNEDGSITEVDGFKKNIFRPPTAFSEDAPASVKESVNDSDDLVA